MPPNEILPGVYFLDRAAGAGASFQVVDFKDAWVQSPPAGADGICVAESPEVESGFWWEIEREAISNTSGLLTAATIYVGDYHYPQNFRDASAAGNKDVADNNQVIRASSAQKVYCVWTGCSVGAVGTLWIQYRKLRRISGGN